MATRFTPWARSSWRPSAYRAAIRSIRNWLRRRSASAAPLIRTDPRAAEAAFLAASALQPDNVAALSNLGVARDMQKHHAAAQEAYRAALALSPDMADVRVNLGLSLALSGQAEQAVQILRPLASDPGATQLWHADLAVALAQSGDLAGARRALAVPGDAAPETDTGCRGAGGRPGRGPGASGRGYPARRAGARNFSSPGASGDCGASRDRGPADHPQAVAGRHGAQPFSGGDDHGYAGD